MDLDIVFKGKKVSNDPSLLIQVDQLDSKIKDMG